MCKFKEDSVCEDCERVGISGQRESCGRRKVASVKLFLVFGKLVKMACSLTEMPPNWYNKGKKHNQEAPNA